MSKLILSRRSFLTASAAGVSSLALAGCDQFDFLGQRDHAVRDFLERANSLTYAGQRALVPQQALARTYDESEIRQPQRPNGSTDPQTSDYLALKANNFADYRLRISGLVETPLSFSLDELRNMPGQSQVTRHDCVEGWSCIGEWSGPQLSLVLAAAVPRPKARYAVFHCADPMTVEGDPDHYYYESLELSEAMHPQTILAHRLNGKILDVPHGAPVRLRAERQLGYKQPKYLQRIVLTETLQGIGGGKGGYWEDQGYEWYAGI